MALRIRPPVASATPARPIVTPKVVATVAALAAVPVGLAAYLGTRSQDELDRMDNPGYCPELNTGNAGRCPR